MTSSLVVLTPEELREIVRGAVSEALAEREPETAPSGALLARSGLAMALGCSLATLDRMVRDGCPHVIVGKTKRFNLARVQEWLATRTVEPAEPKRLPVKTAAVSLAGVRRLSRGAR